MLSPAEELLELIAAHPESGSLACNLEPPLFAAGETPRLLGRATDFLIVAEAARQLAAGAIDRAERVPIEELDRLNFASEKSCQPILEKRISLSQDSAALADLLPLVIGEPDATVRDWLLLRIGREAIEAACERCSLVRESAPVPLCGEQLVFVTRDDFRGANLPPRSEAIGEAWRMGELLRREKNSLSSERHLARTNPLGLRERAAFSRNAAPRGTASSLLHALEQAEKDLLTPIARAPIVHVGTLQAIAFTPATESSPMRIAVLLADDLAEENYFAALNAKADVELVRKLLDDPVFLSAARARLSRPPLDRSVRDALAAEWKKQLALPVPADSGPIGCAASIAAGLALFALYKFLPSFHLGGPLELLLALLLIGGFLYAQIASSFGRNVLRARVEHALTILAGSELDAKRLAAVELLANLEDARGPSSSTVVPRDELRARIGDSLDLVLDVERALREELNIKPHFSVLPSAPKAIRD